MGPDNPGYLFSASHSVLATFGAILIGHAFEGTQKNSIMVWIAPIPSVDSRFCAGSTLRGNGDLPIM